MEEKYPFKNLLKPEVLPVTRQYLDDCFQKSASIDYRTKGTNTSILYNMGSLAG